MQSACPVSAPTPCSLDDTISTIIVRCLLFRCICLLKIYKDALLHSSNKHDQPSFQRAERGLHCGTGVTQGRHLSRTGSTPVYFHSVCAHHECISLKLEAHQTSLL